MWFNKKKKTMPLYISKYYEHIDQVDLKQWLQQKPTKEFFRIVKTLMLAEHEKVHEMLMKGNLREADLAQAATEIFREVLRLPIDMIENSREDKK